MREREPTRRPTQTDVAAPFADAMLAVFFALAFVQQVVPFNQDVKTDVLESSRLSTIY